jgi:5-methylcytosine-specific restriction enzyme A
MPEAPLAPCRAPGCAVIGPCPQHDVARGRLERQAKPAWSSWYHIARWRHPVWGLRTRALAQSPLCVLCSRTGNIVEATEVDHIVPHRGDPALFWSLLNVQPLCKRHHDEKTARGE